MSSTWFDGICNICGSAVIETDARHDHCPEAEEACADYKNKCSNEECVEHKWHYVGDQDFLDYYKHRR